MRRKYPLQPIVGVGALILCQGKLLIAKRGVEPGRGKWSIPGGAVELGERVRYAVLREVEEECGLAIEFRVDIPLDVVDNILADNKGRLEFHYVLLLFLARPRSGTLKPAGDVLDARWVPFEAVEKYDLTESFGLFFKKHRGELESF